MPEQLPMNLSGRSGHFARIENSPRLRKVLNVLQDERWHSTFSIMLATKLCAVGSAVSELRANGYNIKTRCAGRGKYEYRLVKE